MNVNAQCHEWAVEAQIQARCLVNAQIELDDCECALLADRIIAAREAELSHAAKVDQAMSWIAESDYIDRTAAARDWSSFNGEAACFVRYCDMQADMAERQGFANIAAGIRETAGAL